MSYFSDTIVKYAALEVPRALRLKYLCWSHCLAIRPRNRRSTRRIIEWINSKADVYGFYSNVTTLRSGICRRNSVCLSSVMFVHPTQPVDIFGNVSTPSCTLAICWPACTILQRSPEGNPSAGVAKYNDVGHVEGYISETVQDTASYTITD